MVDVHAEATSDKQLLGRYLDGRVSAVLGTHTHVATADEQILPGGTAYQTDVGMTGPHDSILGRRYDRVLAATLTFVPHYFDVATGDPRLCGALVEVDPDDRPRPVHPPRLDRPGRGPVDSSPDLPRSSSLVHGLLGLLEQLGDQRLELAAGLDRVELAVGVDDEDAGDGVDAPGLGELALPAVALVVLRPGDLVLRRRTP